MKRINLDQNRWPTVVTGQWPIYSHWWLHTCELHTEVVLIQNGVVSCLQSLSTHIYRRLLSKYNFSSCVWEWCVGGVCVSAWVDALHYENWKRKKVRCQCVGSEPVPKSDCRQGQEHGREFLMRIFVVFACILIPTCHYENEVRRMEWRKKRKRLQTCFDISVKKKVWKHITGWYLKDDGCVGEAERDREWEGV